MISQTKEDQAINRMVSKRIGSWTWMDSCQPSRVIERHSMARTMTLARTKIKPVISCTNWEDLIK